ncbi:MBL fold metallo-hydrolase [Candidatus Sumerlaeota bacterium]|nr:MBL fold metallo-hydrolase [Candidatus Sumerlaeota bacterium]
MARLIVQCLVSPPLATNAYVVADPVQKRAVIVDPSFVGAELLARVRSQSFMLDAVVLTHGHIDHTHDAGALARETGVAILAHRADETLLADRVRSGADWLELSFESCKISRYLEDGTDLEVGDARLRVLHTPGHSPGSICLLGEDECLTGDLLFRDGVGRWDLPGGDPAALQKSLRRLAGACPTDATILPGHGKSTTLVRERRSNPYLLDWLTDPVSSEGEIMR